MISAQSQNPDDTQAALQSAISNILLLNETLQLEIAISSNQPLGIATLEFIGTEIGGGAEFQLREGNAAQPDNDQLRSFKLADAVAVFHPPFGEYFTGGASSRPIVLPTPVDRFPVGGTYLGRARRQHAKADRWVPVRLPNRDRLRHIYVIGKTGSGKTNLLKSMASNELESPQTGLTVVDPHGDLSSHILNRIPRTRISEIQVLDFSDPDAISVLNPLILDNDDELSRSRVTQEILELLKSRTFHQYTGPRFDELVRLTVDTMLDPGYSEVPSLVDVPLLLTDPDIQQRARSELKGQELLARWRFHDTLKPSNEYADVIDYVVSKFDDLLRDQTLRCFLGGSRNTVDVERVVTRNGILLVTVPERRRSADGRVYRLLDFDAAEVGTVSERPRGDRLPGSSAFYIRG